MLAMPGHSTASQRAISYIQVGQFPQAIACSSPCERIYVTNFRSNSVSVIDTRANKLIGTFAVGNGPTDIAIADRRQHLYVVNSEDGSLSVIDIGDDSGKGIEHREVHRLPFLGATTATYVSVKPDDEKEEKAYVSVYNNHTKEGYIAVIDLESATIMKRISYSTVAYNSVGCPYGNAVTPDGHFLYVNVQCVGALGRRGHDPVFVYSTENDLPVYSVSFALDPNVGSGLAVRPGGHEIWVGGGNACTNKAYQALDEARGYVSGCGGNGGDPITVIDVKSNEIRRTLFRGSSAYLSFTPDGKYFLLPVENELHIIDANTFDRKYEISLGGRSSGSVVFTYNKSYAYTPLPEKGVVAVIDLGQFWEHAE